MSLGWEPVPTAEGELVEEPGDAVVAGGDAEAAGLVAERTGEIGLSRPRRAGDENGLAVVVQSLRQRPRQAHDDRRPDRRAPESAIGGTQGRSGSNADHGALRGPYRSHRSPLSTALYIK